MPNPNVIAFGMFKLDLEPLAPKVLKNRDAHIDYIKHSRKHVDILREIVKNARALSPLDSNLDSAYKYVQRLQEVLVYDKDACPFLTKPSEKLVVVTPLNRTKKVRFAKPAASSSYTQKQVDSHNTKDSNKHVLPSTRMNSSTEASGSKSRSNTKKDRISQSSSSNKKKNKLEDHPRIAKSSLNKENYVIEPMCNANVKHTTLNANSELIYVKCNQCMFDANHDVCILEFVNDVNVHSKSNTVTRNKKNNIWKPSRKMFTKIGYRWKPTGRTFTVVGNICRLTRITSTKLVPLKESISKSVNTSNTEITIYRRKTKVAKSVDLSSELSILGSRPSNISKPNKN
ncbi:hypothetical protein Tco_0801021 [Tanacetum coccineum]|uniref:Uncharacterized protein n=1 Tax=Tanacetum coccineum TaxID=301880 RepID=A0ABQ4ZZ06_9ASTR